MAEAQTELRRMKKEENRKRSMVCFKGDFGFHLRVYLFPWKFRDSAIVTVTTLFFYYKEDLKTVESFVSKRF